MRRSRTAKWTAGAAILFLLPAMAGCFSPLSKNVREQVDPNISFDALRTDPEAFLGKVAILGGEIVRIENKPDGTLLEVLEKRLDRWRMPREEDKSRGRFFIETSSFLDPLVYSAGRRITVAAEVIGKQAEKIGELDYTYPCLRAIEIHLWPESEKNLDPYPYPFPAWHYWYFHRYPLPPWY